MSDTDKAMRQAVARMPVPEFETTAFSLPPPLSEASVAIVTSAALYVEGEPAFAASDPQLKALDDGVRNLRLGHFSPNFDRGAYASDLNVVYPVDRLHELADRGVIGRVAPRHYSCAGNQDESVSRLRLDTGPQAAKQLLADGVHVVLLAPV